MQIGHSGRVLLFAFATALTLTGCTGSSKPKRTATPTFSELAATGSPTGSSAGSSAGSARPTVARSVPNTRPGEKPPVLPAAARSDTALGATEFARFWIEALDWGYATTDSTLARHMYASSCAECARLVSIIDSARTAGNYFRGGRIDISAWIVADNDGRHRATQAVDVTYSQSAIDVLAESGIHVGSSPGVTGLVRRVWVRPASHSWSI
ncbi:MAG: hypothetical protein JWO57_2149, partial [Pseudonocardiales bacterium]|nr:hypothetical protein [Pseudonocardiales bacterium]